MKTYLVVLIAAVLIIVPGILHGQRTNRWGANETLQAWTERLEKVPAIQMLDWEGEEIADDIPETVLQQAQYSGYVSMIYKNTLDESKSVRMLIVCGRPGPISVHTPDICYRGLGYHIGPVTNTTITVNESAGATETAQFKTSEFRRNTEAGEEVLKVYWGWTADGNWQAPQFPRMTFGAAPALYKLYLIERTIGGEMRNNSESDTPSVNACEQLFRAIAPKLRETLFP